MTNAQPLDSQEPDPAPRAAGPARAARRGFPREFRVTNRFDFDAAFEKSRRASSSGALLLARRNDRGVTRIGISVGRKFGDAVRRNRAKRLLREAFRLDHAMFAVGFDLVIVPRKPGFPGHLDGVREMLSMLAKRATGEGPSHPAPAERRAP